MKIKNFNIYRQANFIIAAICIHFIFFGYISNIFRKGIGSRLIFLNQLIFEPRAFLAFFILFMINFIMVFRENFFEYGIRNSLWLIPLVIIESWVWYIFIYAVNFIDLLILYFGTIDGYLTILTILIIHLVAAILGAFIKEKYKYYTKTIENVERNQREVK
ncbi:MAG: hypothetical protein EU547_05285 [Promethearchaeota archaeon]|nr:MAG: hypothetical protein EU547_05285 [Candidatus Lokiarchaeota archaeon]